MRAVEVDPGVDGGGLRIVHTADPHPRSREILIDIAAAGVNRADTGQRRGRYAPPPGAPPWPGLECAGVVSAVGADVSRWVVGDRVCALLSGGGYAEKVAVHEDLAMTIPDRLSFIEAAALPEAAATVWSNLMGLGRLRAGEVVLVHGASSGIGTMAIQLARQHGAIVLATAGTGAKLDACSALGSHHGINYREEDFVQRALQMTGGRGVDVVLDIVGADYLQRNVNALAPDGRLVMIGGQSGFVGRLDIRTVLSRRAVVTGSLLRSRSNDEKALIVADIAEHVLVQVASGAVRPVIHTVLPLTEAMNAHRLMESSEHIGKIILTP